MYLSKMSRWIRRAVWAAGSCVVWCPVCVCLTGGGAWWVCACAVGLITITLGSGYTSWTVFNNLLRHGPQSYPFFARVFGIVERVVERGQINSPVIQEKGRPLTNSAIPGLGGNGRTVVSGTQEVVMQEVVLTASSLHNFLVMPWYRLVSPDNHFSYQIKDVLEDMLINMCRRVRESGSITDITSGLIHIYVQHYRQYHRALRKISKKHRDGEPLSPAAMQELQSKYKPLHPALKNPDALQLYYRKLAQIILHHYLPAEVTRCDLILVSLRDLFAQNVLQAFVDLLCDTQWLNTVLAEILTGMSDEDTKGNASPSGTENMQHQNTKASESTGNSQTPDEDKSCGYTNMLASIQEETLSDLQECDPIYTTPAQKGSANNANKSLAKCDSGEAVSDDKFENAEALVEYVRSSSLEKKESRDEEDYKSVSSALGTLISTTAGPLLPDNTLPLTYQPLMTKMWESPVEDKCFVEAPPLKKKKNPFSRSVIEGMKEEDYKLMYNPKNEDKNALEALTSAADKDSTDVAHSEIEISKKSIVIRVEDSECKESETKVYTIPPNLSDMPRSKSCGNITNKEKDSSLLGNVKTIHGSLTELDKSGLKSETKNLLRENSFAVTEEEFSGRKEKGHLVKMLSFDKNDGTDEASIRSNSLSGEESTCVIESLSSNLTNFDSQSSDSLQSCSTVVNLDSKESEVEPPTTLDIPSSPPINDAGFGWENPDLSPIYEESEDLASSIAKLRSLLTERESQHSLGSLSSHGSSESEPKSAQSDPGRYSLEKSRFTFTHKDSSGSLASVKSVSSLESCGNGIGDEDLLEAAEIPLDGRVFLSVSVPATEVHTEPGGAQYTLYTIQYDAIYLCESIAPPPSEAEEEGSSEPVVPEPRMVLQTNCVKRRFREFLTLHAALEEDSRLRSAMKGVKGPNKWLNLPFSKLDSTTIATRKQFLEKYLQSVIQRPELNISTPVKEFLAYGLDSSVSFVKKPLELNVPRLDKLLAKTVSGVFHSIKTALPSFESSDNHIPGGDAAGTPVSSSGGSCGDSIKSRSGGGVLSERRKLAAFLSSGNKAEYELKLDITAEEEECQIEEALILEVSGVSCKGELVDTAYEARETRSMFTPLMNTQQQYQYQEQQLVHRGHQHSVVVGRGDVGMGSGSHSSYPFSTSPFHHLPPPGPRSQGDGCDISTLSERDTQEDIVNEGEEDLSWQEWPLSVGLLEMIVEILSPSDHPLTHQPCVSLLTLTMARITHKWLQAELERLFCDTYTAEYIQNLRDAILAPPLEVSSPPQSPEEIAKSRVKLEESLKDFIPGVVRIAVGEDVMQQAIMRMVNAIQCPTITMDLALHLLDLLATQILPITPLSP